MMNLDAETAMNLVGLILIAALSGGIVAVSLRLRASASSAGPWLGGERLPDEDWRQQAQSAHRPGVGWLQDTFGLKSESGLYQAVEDQVGN